MAKSAGDPSRAEIFLTTVGTGKYQEAAYRWGAGVYRTEYAPEAAAVAWFGKTAPPPPPKALLLVTPEAEKVHGHRLKKRLSALGLDPCFLTIPPGRDDIELFQILDQLGESVPGGSRVVADITHSFRHLSFAWLSALVYLQELKDVQVEKVTYGAFELREGEECPLLDLTPTLHFIRGSHAARSARRAGDFRDLALWMREWARSLHSRGDTEARDRVNRWESSAKKLAAAYHAGLALETGLQARRLLEQDSPYLACGHPLSLVLRSLSPTLSKMAASPSAKDKTQIVLDEPELRRQLHLVDFYLQQGNVARCLRILREWFVNWVLWKQRREALWLDRDARVKAERFLNALSKRSQEGLDRPDPRICWDSVSRLRNHFAHGGYNSETCDEPQGYRERIEGFVKKCAHLLQEGAELPRLGAGRLLLTPLGLSPGPLFTLLTEEKERPDRLAVLTSPQAEPLLEEILARSGWQGECVVGVLGDPFGPLKGSVGEGFPKEQAIRAALAASYEVTVNWTGGTAYLGWLLQQWTQEAEHLGARCRHLVLVDRRPPAEQAADPWRRGEIRVLSGEENGSELG